MNISDFQYELPERAIAKSPAMPRDSAKLLYLQMQADNEAVYIDRHISDLPDLLKPHDLLIINNTKTLPALLHGTRIRNNDTQQNSAKIPKAKIPKAKIQCNLLEPLNLDYQTLDRDWLALAYPSKKISVGDSIMIADDFSWQLLEKYPDGKLHIRFDEAGDALLKKLTQYGAMPIPPYMKRASNSNDDDDYQTYFAKHQGAVATPTAGLHFTENLIETLRDKNINIAEITLHVGAGTFMPIKTENINDHIIHHEWGEITQDCINAIKTCKNNGGAVVAVGTTSMRLLEWAMQHEEADVPKAQQGMVDIFITPGFEFKICDRLMTNFHQPSSTLMALVSAFSGRKNILSAYQYALAHDYRFLSYGDACLLDRKP